MRISDTICEFSTGYLKAIYKTRQASGLNKNPGTNAIKLSNRFHKLRLRIAEKKKETKYQLILKKKKFAVRQEREKKIDKEETSYPSGEI